MVVDFVIGDVMFGDFKDSVMCNEFEVLLFICVFVELLLVILFFVVIEKVVVLYLLFLLKFINVFVIVVLLGLGVGINGYIIDYIYFKVNIKI